MSERLPDVSTVRRAQAIIGGHTASRVAIIADRPGNPLAAEVRRFEGALATRIPVFGQHLFNRAFGFCDETLAQAGQVADWYAQDAVAGTFEVPPGVPTEQLVPMLAGRGYRHTRFHATLAAPAAEIARAAPSPGVEVRQVTGEPDLQAFSEAYHLGWSNSGPPVPMAPWLAAPGWRIYLGLCDGRPAGAAILYQADGDAYLADSAVDPRHRGRGVHRALLDRRCADAQADGAEWIFAGADYLSASYRNMLRAGLGLLYTKALWTAGA